jgi:hypothetical protein
LIDEVDEDCREKYFGYVSPAFPQKISPANRIGDRGPTERGVPRSRVSQSGAGRQDRDYERLQHESKGKRSSDSIQELMRETAD